MHFTCLIHFIHLIPRFIFPFCTTYLFIFQLIECLFLFLRVVYLSLFFYFYKLFHSCWTISVLYPVPLMHGICVDRLIIYRCVYLITIVKGNLNLYNCCSAGPVLDPILYHVWFVDIIACHSMLGAPTVWQVCPATGVYQPPNTTGAVHLIHTPVVLC